MRVGLIYVKHVCLPCRHSEGYPIELAALVLPTQLLFDQPVPVTIPILSSCDSFASAAVAFVYASSQLPTARFEAGWSKGMADGVSSYHDVQSSKCAPVDSAAVASNGKIADRIFGDVKALKSMRVVYCMHHTEASHPFKYSDFFSSAELVSRNKGMLPNPLLGISWQEPE